MRVPQYSKISNLDPGSLRPGACDICGGTNKLLKFRKYGYPIVKCRDCGLVFTDVELSSEQLESLYPREFFATDAEDPRPECSLLDYEEQREVTVYNFLKKLNRVEHLLPKEGRLLDVGCAHGFFLDAVKHRWEVYGVDISEYATSYARDVLGLSNVKRCFIEGLDLPDRYFKIITMWNSLDHVAHPQKALQQVNRLLEYNGILIVYVEDIGCLMSRVMGRYWFPIVPPVHLTYFDRRSIRRALDRAGFDILSNLKVGVELRIKDVLNRLQCQARSRVSYILYKQLENTAIGKIRMNFGSGGNMFVTARKVRPGE